MSINKPIGNKNNDFFCIAAFFALVAGVIAGSVYLTKTAVSSGEGLRAYLEGFAATGAEADKFMVFKKAARESFITLAVVFASGFFKFGIVFTAAAVVRRGFIIGFTTASFVKYYGAKGFLAMAATMPSVLIAVPAFLIFAAVSAGFSVTENKKSMLGFYILFSFLILAVFLVSALSEGYITTSFMGLIFPKQ